MAKIKKMKNSKFWWGCETSITTLEDWQYLLQLNLCIAEISLLHIQLKCTHMFTNVYSSTICNNFKLETTQMSICSRMYKLCSIHTMEYYIAMKTKILLLHTTWTNLTNKILSKKSQSLKSTPCIIPFCLRFKNRQNWFMVLEATIAVKLRDDTASKRAWGELLLC